MNTTRNYAKYVSKNFFVQLGVRNFFTRITRTLGERKFKNVLDAGCGEGFVASHLRKTYGSKIVLKGVDKNYNALQVARLMTAFDDLIRADMYALPFQDNSFDLVLCTEVLEHVLGVEQALQELRRVSRKYCLLSVPLENLFRLCRILGLKNIRNLGKHPEHVHSFARTCFCRIVSKYFHIENTSFSFPWIIILGTK